MEFSFEVLIEVTSKFYLFGEFSASDFENLILLDETFCLGPF